MQRWHTAHSGYKPTLCGLFEASVASVASCCLCRPCWRRGGASSPQPDVERGSAGPQQQPVVLVAAPSPAQMARLSATSQASVGSGASSMERRSAGTLNRSSLRQAFRRDSPSPEAVHVPAVSLQLGDQVNGSQPRQRWAVCAESVMRLQDRGTHLCVF